MINWIKRLFTKKPEITMIAALQNDRGIGYQGNLIYSIKNDMQHFVDQTSGHTVIMGRKNWESIPKKYRPLKNRENIIITRDPKYSAEGATLVSSIKEAIEKSTSEKIYIIGGGQVYTLGLPYADILDLTRIDSNKPADVYFPEFQNKFKLVEGSGINLDNKTNLDYECQVWKRKTTK
jgi:dihydrofolate reductase